MGCRFSCCRASSPALKSIRVVHMNGYVEDFEHPVSVSQVTGKPAKHFVCTRAQLLSPSSKPLKPDSQLQLGQIYFLLPFSLLESSDASPMDLATAATRLTAIAKNTRYEPTSPLTKFLSTPQQHPQVGLAGGFGGVHKSRRARSWKPILETIGERSFTRRSESDLQDK